MRLDVYLIELGFVKSRGRAKNAIEQGHVAVNGVLCTKPSKNISAEDSVEIVEGQDYPKGYFKLKYIQEQFTLISPDSFVLDLGSSAGGFISYTLSVLKNSGHITGVEFSKDFRSELGKLSYEHSNVDVVYDDVFTMDLQKLPFASYDVVLNDMTLEPKASLSALSRMLPVLKKGGCFLQVVKTSHSDLPNSVLSIIEEQKLHIEHIIETPFRKKEIYVVGKKL